MSEAELAPQHQRPAPRRATPIQVAGWLLALGAGGILLASRYEAPRVSLPPGTVSTSAAQPPMLPPGYWKQTRMAAPPRPELMGPPAPTGSSPAEKPFPAPATGAGGIGYLGPVQGPLNTSVPAGPVLGPGWERKPLPNVLAGPPIPGSAARTTAAAPQKPAPTADPTSSELPDEKTVALSRLANPQLQVRPAAPVKAEGVSAEKPLSVQVVLKDGQHRAGEPVSVRVTANLACYAALVLVNAEGKSSTVFQALRPTREFTCLLKAGPMAGTEYLLAVASAQPLNATDLASLVRAHGNGFDSARPAAGSDAAPAAWATAVAHLDRMDGTGKKLQRFEWAVDTAAFVTQAEVVAVKPNASEPKATVSKPREGESALPTSKAPEKPAESPMGESVLPN